MVRPGEFKVFLGWWTDVTGSRFAQDRTLSRLERFLQDQFANRDLETKFGEVEKRDGVNCAFRPLEFIVYANDFQHSVVVAQILSLQVKTFWQQYPEVM